MIRPNLQCDTTNALIERVVVCTKEVADANIW